MEQPLEIDPIVTKYLREEPLSPEETTALHDWISQGNGRSEMLESLKSEVGSGREDLAHLEGIPHSRIWEKLESRIQQDGYWLDKDETSIAAIPAATKTRSIVWRRALVAASLTIIIGSAALWALNRNHPAAPETIAKTPPATDVAPGSNRATLTLADGRRIDLDSSANGLLASQGNTNVTKLSSGELAYNKPATDNATGNVIGTPALYNNLATPKAGQFTLTLPDGTKVWLNNASSIRYPVAFTGKTREVELNGEAYFEVAKDAARPFFVHTSSGPAGPGTVEVLGTSFNVMAYTDENTERTTLIEGSVRYSHGNHQALLKPDEQSVLDNHGNLKTMKDVNVDAVVAWKNGLFTFDHADLQTTMRQLARWYDVTVTYQGNIDPQTFQGKIQRSMPLKTILKGLEGEHIHFELQGRNLIVRP